MSKVAQSKLKSFIEDVHYPTRKPALVSHIQERGADDEIISIMREIPDTTYTSSQEVATAFHEAEATFQTGVWREA
jgi:hypothetical protein